MTLDAHATRNDRSAARAGSPRRRRARWPLAVAAVALLAVGCSSGPGTQEEFVEILTRGDAFTEDAATCIAEQVFAEYELDEEALGRISSAPSYEFLDTTEGVPGFTDFFEATIESCSPVGPTTG